MTRGFGGARWAACLTALALCSCSAIEHAVELRQAAEQMADATGRRPGWAVDTPLGEWTVAAGGELTEDAAIELALTNNRALRADLEVIGQAKAELVQAGLLSNPMLTVMLGLPEAGGRASLDFGLVKDLADLWLIPSRQRAARSMLQQKLLALTDGAVGLIREARTTYATLQYLDSAIKFQDENLEILRQAIDVAQARLRAGSTGQLDVNLLEARRLQVELELLQMRNERRATQLSLLRLMGVSRGSVDWRPTPAASERREVVADELALIAWGLERRLDIQAAGWEVDVALAEFQQQKLRLVQSLGVGLSGERFERRKIQGRNIAADTARASIASGQLTAPEIEPASARRAERRQEIDFVLGPALEVPLPIFDQNQAQIAKTQYRARELHERYRGLEQKAEEEIRAAWLACQLAAQRSRIVRESLLPIQQSNLQVAETAYQAGKETILTVLLVQQDLIQTRLELAAAIRDEAVSAANLERALGGRLPREEEVRATTQPAGAASPSPGSNDDERSEL